MRPAGDIATIVRIRRCKWQILDDNRGGEVFHLAHSFRDSSRQMSTTAHWYSVDSSVGSRYFPS